MRRQRPQAVEHRALPRIPACRRRRKLGMAGGDGAIVERAVVRPDDDRHQIDVRRSEENAHRPRQNGHAAQPMHTAWAWRAPARVPRPAATIRAAVFKGLLAGNCTARPLAPARPLRQPRERGLPCYSRLRTASGRRLVCTIDVQLEKCLIYGQYAQMLGSSLPLARAGPHRSARAAQCRVACAHVGRHRSSPSAVWRMAWGAGLVSPRWWRASISSPRSTTRGAKPAAATASPSSYNLPAAKRAG